MCLSISNKHTGRHLVWHITRGPLRMGVNLVGINFTRFCCCGQASDISWKGIWHLLWCPDICDCCLGIISRFLALVASRAHATGSHRTVTNAARVSKQLLPLGPQFSSVQSLSHVQLFANPWIAACQASLSITNSQSLLKLMSIESVMPSSQLILCHPLLLPPIPPSIRVFSNESTLHMRWPKYWSFSFSVSPSNDLL